MPRLTSCPHEAEVLELIAIGRYPGQASAELVAHVASCEVCRDLVSVALAVFDLQEKTAPAIRVPDASVVWYRAQARARREALERAERPVLAIQIAALAVACVALVAWPGSLAWLTQAGHDVWTWTTGMGASVATDVRQSVALHLSERPDGVPAPLTAGWLAVIGLVCVLLMAPVAWLLSQLADDGR